MRIGSMPIEISARHRGHMGATTTRWSACGTVGLTIVGLFLATGSHCWAVDELPADWVSRNRPTSDQQLVQLFLTPRVAAVTLHSFDDVDLLIGKSLEGRNIDRVLELFERRVSESGDLENAYGIMQLQAANSWAADFKQQLQELPIPTSQEILDDFYSQFPERLVACHASFDRASQRGSKAWELDHKPVPPWNITTRASSRVIQNARNESANCTC